MNGLFQLGELRPVPYFIGVAVTAGLLFFFIGPDDELANGQLLHAIQWQMQTVVPMMLAILMHVMLSKVEILSALSAWSKLLVSGLTAAVLFSPIALVIEVVLADETISRPILVEVFREFYSVAPPIVVCWLAVNLPFQLGYQFQRSGAKPVTTASHTSKKDEPTGFQRLLPDDIRGEIVYLKSELHYLQVITDKGQALILYSLKNAINELLNDYDGLQPHRSYWVNRSYIKSVEKRGREGELLLINQDSVPVSRTRMKQLKI